MKVELIKIGRYGQGNFPWEFRSAGVNELADFTPELDWEPLRKEMKDYGVRNATLMAIAPVESSSVVINSTNGIEMPMSLISTKESKAGSFTQVVPDYHKLKGKYQLMWEQTDCVGYLKTAAVTIFLHQSALLKFNAALVRISSWPSMNAPLILAIMLTPNDPCTSRTVG